MRAAEIREGMVIDMRQVEETYADAATVSIAEFEYALVLADAEGAEPVNGEAAVLIFTDQGNYKLPADYDVPFINYDGAPIARDGEEA